MSTGTIIIALVGILASLIQALSFFLLKQIFAELRSVRDALRDYVPREVCEAKMSHLEQGGHVSGLLLAGAGLLLILLTGCGHNCVSYGDGLMVETTINPETWTFGIAFRHGKIFTAAVKEKAKVTLTTNAGTQTGSTGDKEAKSDVAATTALTIETGDQVTGYVVDLEKAKAQASPAGK